MLRHHVLDFRALAVPTDPFLGHPPTEALPLLDSTVRAIGFSFRLEIF